jgi:hypothetical protein
MDLALHGEAFLDDIDAFVEEWHQGEGAETLAEFLGMTPEEYRLWVEQDAALRFILNARMMGESAPLYEAVAKAAREPVAMRAPNVDEAEEVLAWLRETGRIKT